MLLRKVRQVDTQAQASISVVITVYQRAELTMRSLHTVVHQQYPCHEIVVLADGHHPGLADVVNEYGLHAGMAGRIHYAEHACPRGTYGNPLRRLGLSVATGSHVLFMGHDCLLLQNCLQVHASNLTQAKNGQALSVTALDHWIERNFDTTARASGLPRHVGIIPQGEFRLSELTIGTVDLTCVVFPVATARQVGIFREDWDMIYAADFLSIAACAGVLPVVSSSQVCGAHF
ncbi:glycosyltransferase family 2 protein [Candidatus Dojkabacteria bacterium]|uniref:Glycosyltransferase family 2 protein n=1 Tax=Candidatus Dojkabacteria bacterium TaxID=2099670 RepID=A0A5C7J308_9BACT|nr:MAG: glycosyltransferase family 2 protein [Candidatus Dojkabacteria bacterium]